MQKQTDSFTNHKQQTNNQCQVAENNFDQIKISSFYDYSLQFQLKNLQDILKRFPQPIVLSLQLASKQTFIIQVGLKKIQHYSLQGNLLGQFYSKKVIKGVFMISSQIALIISQSQFNQDKEAQIIIWDLITYESAITSHYTQFCIHLVQIFTESCLICICQKKRIFHNRKGAFVSEQYEEYFKFTCYKYQQNLKYYLQKKPIKIISFCSNQKQRKQKLRVMKLNNCSLIGLVPIQPQKTISLQFYVCDLLQKGQDWKNYKFNGLQKFKKNEKEMLYQHSIGDIWQIKPQSFYVRCFIKPDISKIQCIHSKPPNWIFNFVKTYNFAWQFHKKKVNFLNKIDNTSDIVQFIGNYKNINCWIPHKQYRCDYCWSNVDLSIVTKFTISYINQAHQILAKQEKTFPIIRQTDYFGQLTKICPLPYNNKIFIQFYEESSKQNQSCKVFIKYSTALVIVHLLCQLVEDCEEDLLQMTSLLIPNDQSTQFYWD